MKICKIFLILILCLIGCAGESPNEPDVIVQKAVPLFMPKEISVPQQMTDSDNASAQLTVGYLRLGRVFRDFQQFFLPPDKADTTDWVISWVIDSMTVTLKVTENDTGWQWIVILDGKSYSRWVDYDCFILMEMEQNRSLTAGKCIFYDLWTGTSEPIVSIVYYTGTSGAVCFEFTFYIDGKKAEILWVKVNRDGSGELEYYRYVGDGSVNLMRFRAEWYADGSGQCWVYNELMVVVFHGAW